ncbi:oligopeptidase A [Aliidiomarina maris]|uniref:oligopeptidase A n=1 Tax=Aliidiomarina maris TaxID=531312 RepID=A0A327X0F7_9GAMM|nr:oligopeptidase A [Aliidiomarina maris]MBA3987895.1 oligopeptidase A [Idiomarina sp.]RAJ98320.1 oligopeptidase A [Aliidiomarina maris]RUO24855.1 oligopeptidase A [Aliidiomarina maris]
MNQAEQASNPLLTDFLYPPFSQIKPEHIQPALEQALRESRELIERLSAQAHPTWASLVAPLEAADDKISRIWSPVSHMNAVVSQDALREAHDNCLALLSEYSTWVGQHEGLYAAYQALKDSTEFAQLNQAQQRVITDTLRDFELSGVALNASDKARYGEIQSQLSELGSRFSNQLLDATQAFVKHVTDVSELSGLPDSALQAAAAEAKERELEGYVFTLDIPSYLPVMMYADNRKLREEMYHAFTTRASDQGPNAGEYDNSEVMQQTLALRHELASLLGFENYAELSLATKMAQSPDQVLGFLNDLAARSLPAAKDDMQQLTEFAQQQGVDTLQAWDLAYYGEQLKQQTYAISDEALRPYFPEQQVVSGLFEVAKRLFGVRIEAQQDIDTWHPQVRVFNIYDADNTHRASFYLDLYARGKKRGGAWMAECAVRRRLDDGSLQIPIAYLTCNFNKPVGDQPALFTHDEVITLFHEFGHGLHHMLTQVEVAGVSGINGVAWDAVELPSQFLENWCWETEALAFISRHYQSGDPLPADMLERMLAARNYQSAMQMVRQLEFSLFDMRIHMAPDVDIQQTLNQVREQVAVVNPPSYNRFQHSFGHIFAGGYAAGYYSYKWAEVLSADAFARFEEEGIFNPQVGQDFLHAILERGGSDDAMALFTEFRGREPDIQALLRHSGIAA